jgi:shikimate kinase
MLETPLRIALVGMPGSGKSTVGRHVARQLDVPFVDSDLEIERRLGVSIRDYFASHGEVAFRDVERDVIDALTREHHGVIATGGGAVLREINRQHLKARCLVFYLRSTPDELARRLRHDVKRPLLQGGDPLKRLRDLFRERDPLYRETAHYPIETGRPSVPTLVNMLLMQLELGGGMAGQRAPGDAA